MPLNLRQTMIFAAVKRGDAAGAPRSVAGLAQFLPDDFELVDQDLKEMAGHLPPAPVIVDDAEFTEIEPAPVTGEMQADEKPDVTEPMTADMIERANARAERRAIGARANRAPPPPAVIEPPSVIEPPARIEKVTPDIIERANARLIAANESLANARVAVGVCQRGELAARTKLASAISQFQSGFAKFTPLDQAREFAATELEQRRRIASGEAPPCAQGRPANSTIDRMMSGRASLESGKYGAHRRGALPAAMRGGFIGVPKPPSER
jgi:hypothetical protein